MTDPSAEVRRRLSLMNEAQAGAIDSILGGWEGESDSFILPLVDGPPGTGKTTVGVLGSSQYTLEAAKPQVCYLAYTHLAADRALDGFLDLGFTKEDVLRVVDRKRARMYENDPNYIGFDSLSDLTPNDGRRVRNTPILIGTLHSAHKILREIHTRSLIVIDEFSQVPPSLFFSTIRITMKGNPTGYSLLGDPNQLPVLTTQSVLRPNIGVYLMARRGLVPHQLSVQYRMHQTICNQVNALRRALNTYPLESDPSVRDRTLSSLGFRWNSTARSEELEEILSPDNPLVLVDTDSLNGGEEQAFTGSKFNLEEAKLSVQIAKGFQDSYSAPEGPLSPTILTPYSAQVGIIKDLLRPGVRANCFTIYRSQGREYPAVIISFVRKNPGKWIGFLGDPELRSQTYVACSRAMGKLVILLSRGTFGGHRDFDYLIEEAERSGVVVNANPTWVS